MRSTIDNRKVIQKGDTTSTSGTVLEGSHLASQEDIGIATMGMKVFCPACKKTGTIIEGANFASIDNKPIALEGHKVSCGCPKNCTLVAID